MRSIQRRFTTVKLPLNRIMIDEGDFTQTTTGTAYFDVVYDIKDGLNFKNQIFFDTMDHKKYSSYGFGAGYTPWVFENKSTLTFSWNPGRAVNLASASRFERSSCRSTCRRGARLVSGHRSSRPINRRSAERPLSRAVQQQWPHRFQLLSFGIIRMLGLTGCRASLCGTSLHATGAFGSTATRPISLAAINGEA